MTNKCCQFEEGHSQECINYKEEKYLGQRCENHPDFFPDECGCYIKNKEEPMPNQNNQDWKDKYRNTLKRAILRVGDNSPASKYLAESAEDFIEQTIHQETTKAVDKRVEKLEFIIKDIQSYSPDGEIGTLCKQALEILQPTNNTKETKRKKHQKQ